MKKKKVAGYGYVLISILFCFTALAYWFFPTRSPDAVCWISGGVLLIYGIIRMIGFFSDDLYCLAFRYDFAYGLLLIVLGVLLWLKRQVVYPYLVPGLGWIVLLDSLFRIQMSKEAKDFGLRQWKIILVIGILTAFSSFLLVLSGFSGQKPLEGLTGCVLLLEGVLNWLTVKFTVKW